MKDIQWFSN